MQTIAFQAKILNGAIEVPEEYRAKLSEIVRVILVSNSEESSYSMIDQLLDNPIQVRDFTPLSRDEIHDRNQ
jgi:hypothetical protein